tara:strand:+ start:345 stop:626 length:282 start_codon:yes stop_codon:yes gene_type:complete
LAWFVVDSKDYIKFIKSHFCVICAKSPVDADHLEHIGMGGNRKLNTLKDYSCIPLCREHHRERHDIGNYQFEHKHSVNLFKEAFYLIRKYFTR